MFHQKSLNAQSGIVHLIVIIIVIAVVLIGASFLFGDNSSLTTEFVPQFNQRGEEDGSQRPNNSTGTTIFDENGVTIVYVWPGGTKNIANEEAEIRVTNNTKVEIEITNPYLTISTSEKVYEPASEGWESFESETARQNYIDKIIIYKSVPESPVILATDNYGRLHYHFLFDDEYAQSANHTATIKFNLVIGSETVTINKDVKRTVEPSDSYESNAENPVGDYFETAPTGGGHN